MLLQGKKAIVSARGQSIGHSIVIGPLLFKLTTNEIFKTAEILVSCAAEL